MKKIQITPVKKIEGATVIWYEQTPDVDIVLDPRSQYSLKMRPGSVKTIYAFGILGAAEPKQIIPMVKNFFDMLEPDGEIYVIEPDFEYLNRAFIGGDLTLEEFNNDFRRGTYLNQSELVKILDMVGFPEKDQRAWYDSLMFKREHYELIISGRKPKR